MSVELKVTLVGDDPQQQQAFNQPTATAASSSQADHSTATAPSQPASSQAQVSPNASRPAARESGSTDTAQDPPVFSTEMRLIDTLEELIRALDHQTEATRPGAGSQPLAQSPQNWFERFSQTVDKKLDEIGLANTSIGNLVSGASNAFAGLGTRATKFASGVFGRGVGAAATTAGTEAAGSAAAGAAGAGVEAGAGAAAGATAAASAAGPLILVALAAGAAALSVKKFMEAVESVAKELADLSPDIAVGQAQHDMRMELMRLDRAQRLGPEVAGLNNAQNRLFESMYEVQTKIYELLLKAAPLIENAVNILDVIVNSLGVQVAIAQQIYAFISTPLDLSDDAKAAKELGKAINELEQSIKTLLGEENPPFQGIDPMLAELFTISGLPGVPPRPPKIPRGPGGNRGRGARP